ncbi:MAG: ABC transporter ATP-binding protein [Anaerolineae bacterium]|nr:ABC transporter ATP-binding protein [Anaerolineae bacterium]
MPPLLTIHEVTRHFDGVQAVDNVSLGVKAGEFVSVIGPNGAGKTTFFNLIAGTDQPTSGQISFDGQSLVGLRPDQVAALGIARTFQNGRVFANLSVLDNVLIGTHARRTSQQTINPLGELWGAIVTSRALREEEARVRHDAESIIALFGERLTPRLHHPASSLSYANRRRVELARALALHPRLLLLDEPTAGMNPTETAEILEFIRRLKDQKLTILLIEHKLSLVMELSDRVIVMDNGRKIAEDVPHVIRRDPYVIEAYLGHRRPSADSAAEMTALDRTNANVQARTAP